MRNQFLSFNRIQQREQRIRELQLLLQLNPSRAGEYKRALVELLRSPVRISSNADGVDHETGEAVGHETGRQAVDHETGREAVGHSSGEEVGHDSGDSGVGQDGDSSADIDDDADDDVGSSDDGQLALCATPFNPPRSTNSTTACMNATASVTVQTSDVRTSTIVTSSTHNASAKMHRSPRRKTAARRNPRRGQCVKPKVFSFFFCFLNPLTHTQTHT